MRKIVTGVAAAVLAAGLLAGCTGEEEADPQGGGTSQTESYCVELEQQREIIDQFDQQEPATPEQIQQAFTAFEALAAAAPPEVEQEWAVVDDAFVSLRQAIEDAGLTLEEFASVQSGEVPEGVEPEALSELRQTVQGVDSERLATAFDAVSEHAESECAVDLTGGGG